MISIWVAADTRDTICK